MAQTQPTTCFCTASELRMALTFFSVWVRKKKSKEEKEFITGEKYVKVTIL